MPKKTLGQHYLTSQPAVAKIVDAANLQEGDSVLEIGPGTGILTEKLLEANVIVSAIEKDQNLADNLSEMFADAVRSMHLNVLCGDVLKSNPADLVGGRRYKVVANIPYYITGAIIRQFLTAAHQPTCMVLLVQKEVAERITARDRKESLLSMSVKAYGEPRIAGTVKAGSFNPPPKVDSAILVIDQISRDFFTKIDEEQFFELLHTGFAQKRKKLLPKLKRRFPDITETTFLHCGIAPDARAEEVSAKEWRCLAQALS